MACTGPWNPHHLEKFDPSPGILTVQFYLRNWTCYSWATITDRCQLYVYVSTRVPHSLVIVTGMRTFARHVTINHNITQIIIDTLKAVLYSFVDWNPTIVNELASWNSLAKCQLILTWVLSKTVSLRTHMKGPGPDTKLHSNFSPNQKGESSLIYPGHDPIAVWKFEACKAVALALKHLVELTGGGPWPCESCLQWAKAWGDVEIADEPHNPLALPKFSDANSTPAQLSGR